MKYDKKIAKHYSRLTENDYKIPSGDSDINWANNLSAIIEGECAHFSASGKPVPNAESDTIKLLELIKTLKGDDSEMINCYGNALDALISYQKITGDTPLTGYAIQNYSDIIYNTLKNSLDYIFSEETDNCFYLLSTLYGLSRIYKSDKNEKFKTLAFEIANRIKNLNLDNYKSSVYSYLQTASALAKFAIFSGESAVNSLIGGLFNNYCFKAQSQNFEASPSFSDTTKTNPASTAKAFELAIDLYRLTGDIYYRTMARRIWFNGMQFCQRGTGGVGTNSFTNGNNNLSVCQYEIKDFITPIYGIGLKCYTLNKQLFQEEEDEIRKDRNGRIFMGDKIFVKDESGFFGRDLIEIPTLTSFEKDTAFQLDLKLNF